MQLISTRRKSRQIGQPWNEFETITCHFGMDFLDHFASRTPSSSVYIKIYAYLTDKIRPLLKFPMGGKHNTFGTSVTCTLFPVHSALRRQYLILAQRRDVQFYYYYKYLRKNFRNSSFAIALLKEWHWLELKPSRSNQCINHYVKV